MISLRLFFVCLLFSSAVNAQLEKDSITAYKIVQNSIDAMGGIEYLKTIKTLYTDMETEMEGRKVNFIIKEMLPNKGSFQIVYKNQTVVHEWFDGKKGYVLKNGEKQKGDEKQFVDKPYKKNIFNEIDFLDSSIWKLKYLGIEMLDADSCYKIEAKLVNGLTMLVLFNKSNSHMVKTERKTETESNKYQIVYYSNFRTFDKLVHPTRLKLGVEGNFQYGNVVNLIINKLVTKDDFK